MSRLVDCWKAVESAINSATWSQPFTVYRKYYHEFGRSSDDERVGVYLVFDQPRERAFENRKYDAETLRLQLVIQAVLSPNEDREAQCDAIIDIQEELTDWLHGRTFGTLYKCNGIEYNEEFSSGDVNQNIFHMAFDLTFLTIQQVRT